MLMQKARPDFRLSGYLLLLRLLQEGEHFHNSQVQRSGLHIPFMLLKEEMQAPRNLLQQKQWQEDRNEGQEILSKPA
ncbi:MAG: hypothetical protein QM426_11275 [Euryarchaeota archaeon]|nr:hypothetical protein [Euryarchaeota archaeon]